MKLMCVHLNYILQTITFNRASCHTEFHHTSAMSFILPIKILLIVAPEPRAKARAHMKIKTFINDECKTVSVLKTKLIRGRKKMYERTIDGDCFVERFHI